MTTLPGSGLLCLTWDAVFWTSDVAERNRRRRLEAWSEEPQRGGLRDGVSGSECCPRGRVLVDCRLSVVWISV